MKQLPNACDQKVSVLQTNDYVAVSPFTPLSQAIEAMKQDEGGCVIVSDDGRIVGIFTERDLLTKVWGEDVDLSSPIRVWMQPAVETLTPEATIGDAVRLMEQPDFPQPVGIFRAVERTSYDQLMADQIETAIARSGPGSLEKLIYSGDMWTVE